MCDRAIFHQNRPNGFGDIKIFRFSRWPPSAMLDSLIIDFLNIPKGSEDQYAPACKISSKSVELL